MISEMLLFCDSAFLSAFTFSTQYNDSRWCLELQRVRTVLWTWTVRLEICSVLRMHIQPVQVELEFWQSKATTMVSAVIFVCTLSVQFFFFPNIYFLVQNVNINKVYIWIFCLHFHASFSFSFILFSLHVAVLLFFPQAPAPQRILSQRCQGVDWQAPAVYSSLGQLCGPAQVLQAT